MRMEHKTLQDHGVRAAGALGAAGAAEADGVTRAGGLAKLLPPGPVTTAWLSALPLTSFFHDRNQIVHPSPHVPATGLPTTLTGSPRTAWS